MQTNRFVLGAGLGAVALCAFSLASCNRSPAADVAATVNGRPITYAEVNKHFQQESTGSSERASDEQATIQKLEILRVLVDNEIVLQRAEKLSLIATDADVDAKVNELKAGYTQEEFQKQLSTRKMTLQDLREQVRRDLSIAKLINKEITSHISINEKEISEYYGANRANFNVPEPRIHLAQIVVTAGPEPVQNLKNDNATTPETAEGKIRAIEARARQGEDFTLLARNFSEDPQTAPSGGDLGLIAESQLGRLDPELRRQISLIAPGQMSGIMKIGPEYRILKVIAREPAGQRELNDPAVQQHIRETLQNRKDQILRRAFYEVARNDSKVVNHFAQGIVDNKGIKK